MGSTIPKMLLGWGSTSHSNFCPQDIAPPGTVHSRFKTGSAYSAIYCRRSAYIAEPNKRNGN